MHVNLGDFESVAGLHDSLLARLEDLDEDLAGGHVVELILALELHLLQTGIVHVHTAAQVASQEFAAVVLPAHCGHRVVVLDVLARNLLPLASLGVHVVHVEPVEVAQHNRVA